MQIKTNYQLCGYIDSFIDQTVSAEDLTERRNPYFALYVFLLHKIFNVKIDFCKELVSIYARKQVEHEGSDSIIDDIYIECINAIVAYNDRFEHSLKERAEDDEMQLMMALSAVSNQLLEQTKQGATMAHNEVLLGHISVYIEKIAEIFNHMPMHHDTLEDFAKKHSIKLD